MMKINYNPNQPYIPGHPYRIIIIEGSWSGKANVLLNLIKYQQPDIEKKLFIHERSIWIKVSITY